MARTDNDILLDIGLTGEEVRDFETKFWNLAQSLDRAQLAALKQATPTAESAAKTLSHDVTSQDLMDFVRAHAPDDASVLFFFNGIVRE